MFVDAIADRMAFVIAGPPWRCSSKISSPVTVRGDGK